MKSRFLVGMIIGAWVLYCSANILASQLIFNPLLFRLVTLEDTGATREFLANLEGSPLYEGQNRYFNSLYNSVFSHEIDVKHLNSEKASAHYEELLQLNPKSRDVLVELALLKTELGQKSEAKAFYMRAKEIDPWLQISKLDRL